MATGKGLHRTPREPGIILGVSFVVTLVEALALIVCACFGWWTEVFILPFGMAAVMAAGVILDAGER